MSRDVAEAVRLASIPAIVINNTYQLLPGADLLVANDSAWWANTPGAHEFQGLKFCGQDCSSREILYLRNTGTDGYDPDPQCFRTGGNSGYTALHIAAQAGAKRILLFGFDMRMGEQSHWHGDHPKPLRNSTHSSYRRFIERFDGLASILKRRGVEVLNATPGSALKCFQKIDGMNYNI